MSDIDFGSSQGEQLATLVRVVRDMHRDFYGNGKPRHQTESGDFHMDQHAGAERERENQHKSNTRKLNAIMLILTAIGLVIAIVGIIVSVEVAHRADMDPARIFHSFVQDVQLSFREPPPLDSANVPF